MNLEGRLLNIQHRWNPLHVYCRLVDRGFSKNTSIKICRCYEFSIYWMVNLVSIAGIFLCRTIRRKVPLSAILTVLVAFLLLVATARAADVSLAWDANTETDLIGYKLYRAEKIGDVTTAWVEIATIPAGTETYTDTVDNKKSWAWLVTAYNSEDESFVSNCVHVKKPKAKRVDNFRK